VLRTHTSPNQIRVMERTLGAAGGAGGDYPPVRVVVPGRCYRYEAQDASHEWMFYQVEGLAVDVGLTMADLKGVLTAFDEASALAADRRHLAQGGRVGGPLLVRRGAAGRRTSGRACPQARQARWYRGAARTPGDVVLARTLRERTTRSTQR